MRDNKTPTAADGGLSTDDIAGTPRGTGADSRERRGRSSDSPPVYPGESAPTGTDPATGREAVTGSEVGATRRDTVTGTEVGATRRDTVTGTEVGATRRDSARGTGPGATGLDPAQGGEGDGRDTARVDERDGYDEAGARPAEARRPSEVPASGERDESTTGAPHLAPQLLDAGDEDGFRTRWHDIQSQFVDDPRKAVHAADGLVAEVMQQLAATFAEHRKTLESQWNRGEDVDTESLRTALRQYRSFFHRLLSTGADGGEDVAAADRRR
ncbi:hypothetical protein [Streptomyces venezuelae]|uniref:hypothetical protein n=1 Tax=Streptomyces venezuelae TaxID=54571 RepID=UPI00278C1D84|nr:hypothetical protein [Streptomyces venezuelae]